MRDDKGDGHGNNLSSIDLARRRLEHYVLDHKVRPVSADSKLPSSSEDKVFFKRCHEWPPNVEFTPDFSAIFL